MMLRARSISRASAVKIELSLGRALLRTVLFKTAAHAALPLSSEELAVKLTGAMSPQNTSGFSLNTKVPGELKWPYVASRCNAYMSACGSVEKVTTVRSAKGTAHGDFVLNISLNRKGFQAIFHIGTSRWWWSWRARGSSAGPANRSFIKNLPTEDNY